MEGILDLTKRILLSFSMFLVFSCSTIYKIKVVQNFTSGTLFTFEDYSNNPVEVCMRSAVVLLDDQPVWRVEASNECTNLKGFKYGSVITGMNTEVKPAKLIKGKEYTITTLSSGATGSQSFTSLLE
jgi:hypothetical protein